MLVLLMPVVMAEVKPLEIKEVWTSDMQGNPKSTFAPGETVVVHVKIEYPPGYYYYYDGGSISYLLIIEVFTPTSEVLALGFTTGVISSGETVETGYGFTLSSSASSGTYTIEVYVWNGWPAVMGAGWKSLANPVTSSFTVSG